MSVHFVWIRKKRFANKHNRMILETAIIQETSKCREAQGDDYAKLPSEEKMAAINSNVLFESRSPLIHYISLTVTVSPVGGARCHDVGTQVNDPRQGRQLQYRIVQT